MNADWHRQHVLGSHATLDERIAWHLEHERECHCRTMPASLREEVERRGLGHLLSDGDSRR